MYLRYLMYYHALLNYLLLIVGMHLYNHVYHISIKGMSNSFPFLQSYQPGYSSHEHHDLLVSWQTEQRLFISMHYFSSQVADPGVYVYTNLFSSAT